MAKIAFTKEDLIAACKIHGCDFSKNTINAILKELGDKATNAKQIHDCIYRWNIKDALTAEKKGKAGNNNLKDDFEKLSKVLNEGSTNEIAGNGEEVINNDPIKESVDKDVENVLINQETIEETSITKPRDLPVDNVNTEIGEDALEANPGLEESIAPETRFWPAEEPIRKPGMIGKMLKVAAVFGNFSNLLYSFNGEKIIINGHMPSLDPKDMDKLADEFLDVQQFFTNGAII